MISRSKALRPAVFLDRDGVLNVDTGYVFRREDFVWVAGAKEAVRLLNEMGYFVFVVTNQSGIARGYYTEADVAFLHRWVNRELNACGARVDAFYYCPHHPEAAVELYRKACSCRKPAPGLILRALKEWPVDRGRSFLIGDKRRDLEAAAGAGLPGYLFEGPDLYEFVRHILAHNLKMLP
ncbi:MAG: D-glycero-alpha-D-manno-heptose-1,7-bisphosphate 7-phosphatase [Bacillota bacterium]